jgi:hypothetical protein
MCVPTLHPIPRRPEAPQQAGARRCRRQRGSMEPMDLQQLLRAEGRHAWVAVVWAEVASVTTHARPPAPQVASRRNGRLRRADTCMKCEARGAANEEPDGGPLACGHHQHRHSDGMGRVVGGQGHGKGVEEVPGAMFEDEIRARATAAIEYWPLRVKSCIADDEGGPDREGLSLGF